LVIPYFKENYINKSLNATKLHLIILVIVFQKCDLVAKNIGEEINEKNKYGSIVATSK
jgi:uncharacterized membrane protein YjfL (UPF0719 family)